jgi:hypothetical protein
MRAAGAGDRGRVFAPGAALRRGPLFLLAAVVVALSMGDLWPRLPGLSVPLSGMLTLFGMVLAAVYMVRRRFLRLSLYTMRPFVAFPPLRRFAGLAVRLDRLRTWRMVHVLIGVLCLVPLWWHVRAAQGGLLERGLLVVVALVIVSGVLGVLLQYAMPQTMLAAIEREVRVNDVRARQSRLFVEAEERILGRSTALVDAYLKFVRPVLQGETRRRRLLEATIRRQDPGGDVRGRALRGLEDLDETDASTYRAFIELAEEKVRLDLNLFQLALTTQWLALHGAAVMCMAGLIGLHIFSVLYFGGL